MEREEKERIGSKPSLREREGSQWEVWMGPLDSHPFGQNTKRSQPTKLPHTRDKKKQKDEEEEEEKSVRSSSCTFFIHRKKWKKDKNRYILQSSAPETVRCKPPRAQKLCKSHEKNHRESKKYFPCKKIKWN